tara:strand:+ start:223 stop:411 length:189 start_codon:yes stop_codon:yes gene_type:complete
MKDRRVTFNLNPIVKEFYRDDIVYPNESNNLVYPNESNNLVYIYIFGAIFITYVINTYKQYK